MRQMANEELSFHPSEFGPLAILSTVGCPVSDETLHKGRHRQSNDDYRAIHE
jgi:hypothetical protein